MKTCDKLKINQLQMVRVLDSFRKGSTQSNKQWQRIPKSIMLAGNEIIKFQSYKSMIKPCSMIKRGNENAKFLYAKQ